MGVEKLIASQIANIQIGDSDLAKLRQVLQGELVFPGDTAYEQARRVWNGAIDRRPAGIVRCADANDVQRAIEFARRRDWPIAVRGGGHSTAGFSTSEGGLVIDLSPMKSIRVDPETSTAQAQAGLTLGELIQETQRYGLATTTGIVSDTGIAGLTLGGGIGWLAAQYGLTCDNVSAFEVITPDGVLRRADPDENPDLFWGLRGGGGNFGIVTNFHYRLHDVGPVLAGMVIHPMAQAREALRFYRDYTATAPDELTAYAALLTTPEGERAIAFILCYAGELQEGERIVKPIRRWGPPVVDLLRPMSYLEAISLIDAANPAGRYYAEKGNTVPELKDEVIDILVENASAGTSPFSVTLIQHLHGVATRIAPHATAFPVRKECYVPVHIAAWEDGDAARHRQWLRTSTDALRPFELKETYVNFMSEEGSARVRSAYGANYDRLVALKNRYDPDNLFHLNQNIKPNISPDAGW